MLLFYHVKEVNIRKKHRGKMNIRNKHAFGIGAAIFFSGYSIFMYTFGKGVGKEIERTENVHYLDTLHTKLYEASLDSTLSPRKREEIDNRSTDAFYLEQQAIKPVEERDVSLVVEEMTRRIKYTRNKTNSP